MRAHRPRATSLGRTKQGSQLFLIWVHRPFLSKPQHPNLRSRMVKGTSCDNQRPIIRSSVPSRVEAATPRTCEAAWGGGASCGDFTVGGKHFLTGGRSPVVGKCQPDKFVDHDAGRGQQSWRECMSRRRFPLPAPPRPKSSSMHRAPAPPRSKPSSVQRNTSPGVVLHASKRSPESSSIHRGAITQKRPRRAVFRVCHYVGFQGKDSTPAIRPKPPDWAPIPPQAAGPAAWATNCCPPSATSPSAAAADGRP